MKRIISIIAVVAMLLTLTSVFAACGSSSSVPASVVNKAVDSSEKVKWSYDNSSYTLSIVGDENNPVPMFEKAPKSPDDIPWKSIRNYVAKVEISGVTDIPDYAFYSMVSLKTVKFEDKNVTSIGKCAFAFCNVLSLADVKKSDSSTPITLPEGIKSIGESAFEGCSSLTEINLPSTVEKIGEKAFAYDYNLKKVTKPEDLKLPDNSFIILSGNTTKPNTKVEVVDLEDVKEEEDNKETETENNEETKPSEDSTETKAPDNSNSDKKDEDKKTNTTTTIIAISILAVVIIGVIIGAVLLIRSNKKQTKDARTVRKNDNDKNDKNAKNGKKGKKK